MRAVVILVPGLFVSNFWLGTTKRIPWPECAVVISIQLNQHRSNSPGEKGSWKTVQIRCGPAAVIGDEIRCIHCLNKLFGWEGPESKLIRKPEDLLIEWIFTLGTRSKELCSYLSFHCPSILFWIYINWFTNWRVISAGRKSGNRSKGLPFSPSVPLFRRK